jgi:predicted amidophosphoribosyltransferase
MTYIICPGCESVVRELDDTPCPNCRRCPLCSRKLKKDEERCGSTHPGAEFGGFFSHLVIAEKDVPRERRRIEIRVVGEYCDD